MGREGDAQPQTVHGVACLSQVSLFNDVLRSLALEPDATEKLTFCLVEFDVFMRTLASCLVVMVAVMCSYIVIEPSDIPV